MPPSDETLVACVLSGSTDAEDQLTARMRTVVARVAAHIADADRVDELLAPVLLGMLQSERRWLPGWTPGSATLNAYLAVVAARMCVVEADRWGRLALPSSAAAPPVACDHPGDARLAAWAEHPTWDQAHLDCCPRCSLVVGAARAALRNL